jgi:hypothetical protein
MPEKVDPQQAYDFKELLIAEMIEIDTITQLLIEKGIITQQEYLTKLKHVKHDYEKKRRS